MFDRIAVPLDGSEFSEMALPWAVELAAAFGSELHVVSVCETDIAEHRNMHRAYIEHKAEETLPEVLKRLPGGAFQPAVKPIMLEGAPSTQILGYVEKAAIDLLILVSHGRSGIMAWTMGSTAAKILNRITSPVLFVRAREKAATPVSVTGHIMVPLDGSPKAEVVLPYVQELASKTRSRVTLFRALPPGYQVPTIGGINYIPLPNAEVDRLRDEAQRYLDSIGDRLSGLGVEKSVCVGDASDEINKFAGGHAVSLIALLGRGKVVHKLVNSATTSLLLLGSGEHATEK